MGGKPFQSTGCAACRKRKVKVGDTYFSLWQSLVLMSLIVWWAEAKLSKMYKTWHFVSRLWGHTNNFLWSWETREDIFFLKTKPVRSGATPTCLCRSKSKHSFGAVLASSSYFIVHWPPFSCRCEAWSCSGHLSLFVHEYSSAAQEDIDAWPSHFRYLVCFSRKAG